jgi:hypothetical protein
MPSKANIDYPGEVIEQVELSLQRDDLRDLTIHPRVIHPRSHGVHVSGVIKVIAIRQKLLKDEDQIDDMPTVVLLGTVWEEAAARLYRDMVWQPGEVGLDGIYGSPDGSTPIDLEWYKLLGIHASINAGNRIVDEFKFTYKSNRNRQDIRRERLWMMQVMAYLKMMGLTVARLHVLWACDNYVMPFRPKYIRYTVRFTQAELDRNWALLMKFKQFAVREG